MLPSYADIRSRIADPPIWHDRHGVPRYEAFDPSMLGVYDDFAILAEIACQRCGERFLVGGGWTRFDVFADPIVERNLEALAESFDYGDPPRHDDGPMGRCAGETMHSETVRVVEAWEQVGFDWVRREVGGGSLLAEGTGGGTKSVEESAADSGGGGGSERVCVSCGAAFIVEREGLYLHDDAGGPLCGRCAGRWGE
ncbi:MAG: hypothetical protein M1522_07235 [Actinobacteria bacterium]|jgi:DNA-directed RNA polymerase subunit RPC12/RpoP|nr:hypothetical protein [Actinomycetota bacterium]